jgi:hypothetical protein
LTLNREAMQLPAAGLLPALAERIARRSEQIEARDRQFGADRIRVASYMENLGWPPLFGYDFNRFYQDPEFMLEQELRQRIFWLDNTVGDDQAGLDLSPTTGFYWDITLFGQQVQTSPGGVPQFLPHPLAGRRDLRLLERFAFQTSGHMPILLHQHRQLRQLSRERCNDRVGVGFPCFHRGPLDILIQMRGYEAFLGDLTDDPAFVTAALALVVGERVRWNRERAAYLGEPFRAEATFIADDWVNPPFISPAIFRDFVVPAYQQIQQQEGPVTGFHTCGPLGPLVGHLLATFPAIRTLDVSGWNDLDQLDAAVDPAIGFQCQVRNATVLAGTPAEQRVLLDAVRRVATHRQVGLNAQSIVMLHPDLAENFRRLNDFVELARITLAVGAA